MAGRLPPITTSGAPLPGLRWRCAGRTGCSPGGVDVFLRREAQFTLGGQAHPLVGVCTYDTWVLPDEVLLKLSRVHS